MSEEQFEKVKILKDKFLCLVEEQLNGDISHVDAKELGEVVDCAKDMAEIIKLCSEAKYYHEITEAMEKNSDEENKMYMNEYLPESKYYYPINYKMRIGGRRYYHDDIYPMAEYKDDDYMRDKKLAHERMYFDNGMANIRDKKEGRSPLTRKTYMDMMTDGTDKGKRMEEMEKYLHDLADDINEMIANADPTEKQTVKSKLTTLATKIV